MKTLVHVTRYSVWSSSQTIMALLFVECWFYRRWCEEYFWHHHGNLTALRVGVWPKHSNWILEAKESLETQKFRNSHFNNKECTSTHTQTSHNDTKRLAKQLHNPQTTIKLPSEIGDTTTWELHQVHLVPGWYNFTTTSTGTEPLPGSLPLPVSCTNNIYPASHFVSRD